MFKRILVANRGEIAVRIIRSCKEMGIESVAVYSDADYNALHIVHADYAVCLPGTSSVDTYLNMELLIAICKQFRVDALHPGYGFLAENPEFAQLCADNGIAFIGPSPQAMRDLGNKIKAKEIARAAGTPVVPGSDGAVDNAAAAEAFAAEHGLPLIFKAAAGGGGRGMRVVRKLEDIPRFFQACQNEASSAFNSREIFIERYIENPKHIEFQILGDQHGNCIHLNERDCSIQRRHQKLIEEAPSPALSPELREKMGRTAVAMAQAAGYSCAGTVEFLLDQEGRYYFMEMNARLQVEHPVTEMVTFVDLVRAQIHMAAGDKLHLRQEECYPRGWAIEVRINAEDPLKGFIPALGRINRYIPPAGGGVRLDSCAYEGYTIPQYYDSMVAKLITFGRDRQRAIQKLRRALDEFVITGVRTTIPFHRYVVDHPAFVSGDFRTGFVEEHFSDVQVSSLLRSKSEHANQEHIALAAALQYYIERTELMAGNRSEDYASSRRWQLIHRLNSTSFMPN